VHSVTPITIADKAPHYQEESLPLLNLMLDTDRVKFIFDPITESISKNIEFSFKTPAKIEFLSTIPIKFDHISQVMQFDDICIRLYHTDTAKDFFFTFPTAFPRSMLMRLLSPSIIDESPNTLFSSTEKGLFSFIMARLLAEIKKILGETMPNLKFLGIFNSADEAIRDFQISRYGACNFKLSFLSNDYFVIVFYPIEMLAIEFDPPNRKSHLFARCGHISGQMLFKLIRLNMTAAALMGLCPGDLILFDNAKQSLDDGVLNGKIHASWNGINLIGKLEHNGTRLGFLFEQSDQKSEDCEMEQVEISGTNELPMSETKIGQLAKNLRVELSIEISRIPMTLKEVCELRPGEIIDLHRKLEDPLEIVLEKKVIGYCTPIQIDGRLGIKILSIEQEKEPPIPSSC
jgi:flagellar motor switch/type III secretory pathway protein FliN